MFSTNQQGNIFSFRSSSSTDVFYITISNSFCLLTEHSFWVFVTCFCPAFRCRKCHPSCKECFGEHPYQCLECQRGMIFRSNRLCSWTCPPGAYYKDIKEQICKPCHPACTQCYGPSSRECQRCVGKFLNSFLTIDFRHLYPHLWTVCSQATA